MSSCGLSYTAETTEDSGLEEFGVPAVHEVADLCETWTGWDYQLQVTTQSSDSPEFTASGGARIVAYSNGLASSYGGNGSLQNTSDAGSTAFAMVNASSDEVQASFDEPYYAILGGSGGGDPGGCYQPDCYQTLRAPVSATAEGKRLSGVGLPAANARRAPDASTLRHGLSRKGVRFRVNSFDEVASGRPDRRRFSKKDGDREHIIELDKTTQLVVVDEEVSPKEYVRAEHQWRKFGKNMYVIARTDVDAQETAPDGRKKHQRTTIRISNVKLGGQP